MTHDRQPDSAALRSMFSLQLKQLGERATMDDEGRFLSHAAEITFRNIWLPCAQSFLTANCASAEGLWKQIREALEAVKSEAEAACAGDSLVARKGLAITPSTLGKVDEALLVIGASSKALRDAAAEIQAKERQDELTEMAVTAEHNFQAFDLINSHLCLNNELLTNRTEEKDGPYAAALNVIDSIEAIRKAKHSTHQGCSDSPSNPAPQLEGQLSVDNGVWKWKRALRDRIILSKIDPEGYVAKVVLAEPGDVLHDFLSDLIRTQSADKKS